MNEFTEVVAALIKQSDKVFLCQRQTLDRYGSLWEFPGGAVEAGETQTAAIEREILEEVGLEIKAETFLNDFFDEDPTLKIHLFLYLSTITKGTPQTLECKALGFFTLKEAAALDLAPVDRKILDWLKTPY